MKVRCLCSSAIAVSSRARVSWADVWLRFRTKGKRYCFGPTLMTRYDLRGDLLIAKECAKEHPEILEFEEEILELEAILKRLDTEPVIIEGGTDGCPDIYTTKNYINQHEAEKMIGALMRSLGHEHFTFDWPQPRVLCHPMTFDVDKAEAAMTA